MSKIEVAFSEFISANPAPDPAVLHRDRPNVDEVLSRAEGVSRMPRTIRSAPWRISRGWRVRLTSGKDLIQNDERSLPRHWHV
jgi:hypothetical protein